MKINVCTGYNNIHFREGDESKAAFNTNEGLFKPTVMPFGLRNAPAVFQCMVNTQFTDILAEGGTINYMDDFLVATKDKATHREKVNKLLEWLQKLDLYLKPDKCVFEMNRVKFLGVILENGTVMMDPIKVAGVADWKTLKNIRDIRKFLGFVNFYQRFIPNHSKKAKPLNDLLKKNIPFEWKQEQEDTFKELKQAVQTEPVLLQPSQRKPFEVEIDLQLCHWSCVDAKG